MSQITSGTVQRLVAVMEDLFYITNQQIHLEQINYDSAV